MSDSPCTGCRATSNGRLFYVYVNHYVNEDVEKRRVRICKNCVFDLLAPLLEGADYLENRQWVPVEIASGQNTHIPAALAVTRSLPVEPITSTSTITKPPKGKRSAGGAGAPSA